MTDPTTTRPTWLRLPRQLPGFAQIPLRVKLVLALVVLAAVGLTATGAVVTTQLRGYLVSQVDADLAGQIPPSLASGGTASGGVTTDDGGRARDGDPFGRGRPEWLRLLDPQGAPLTADRETEPDEPGPAITRAQILAAGPQPFTVPAAEGRDDWRVVVQRGTVRGVGDVIAVRGISLGDVRGTVGRLVLLEFLVGLLVLGVLGGLAYLVVRTSLRPLEEVEGTAAAIAAGDLTQRVPESDRRTEVGRLSGALNGMLAQIELAFRDRERSEASARASEDRMRRFVADASHELRTPLTSIRGYAELFRQGAVADPAEMPRLMRRIEDEAARMGLLVEDLLLLARLDQQRPLQRTPVDLLEIVSDAAYDARVLAPDRTIELDVSGPMAPVVVGDGPRLRQVVTNLVSNALTHTPAGTPVELSLATVEGHDGGPDLARVVVLDHGPGLPPDDRERVFERFYRADKARTRAAGGSGLGLSIVAALVAAHGGRVGVESEPGSGTAFTVELPLVESRHPAVVAPGSGEDRPA